MDKFTPEFIKSQRELANKADGLPWGACHNGDCTCGQIWTSDNPIATFEMGEWGDEYPSVRIVGDTLSVKAEAYMEKIVYGEIPVELARASIRYTIAAANNYPDALAEIERLREAQRWIPVSESEELNNLDMYLVTDGRIVTVGFYSTKWGTWTSADDLRLPFEVTHWMPLPEPPQEAEG